MPTTKANIRAFDFHIWERLRLQVGNDDTAGLYSCRITDITDDHLVTSRPTFEGGKSLLAENRMVTAYCARADAAYSFTARVKETDPKSDDRIYLMDIGPVARSQRRRFVRLDIVVPLKYRRLHRPLSAPVSLTTHDLVESHSINLSAGGMLITVSRDIKVDELLILSADSHQFTHLPRWLLTACRYVSVRKNREWVAGLEIVLREDLPRFLTDSELRNVPENLTLFDDRMQNEFASELFAKQLLVRQKGIL